jgi:hypothetical protein
MTSRSRGGMRPSCGRSFRPKKQRAQGMPGVRCTRGPCAKNSTRSSPQVHRPHAGIPCAMVLTVYSALPPATNSSCHRRRRIDGLAAPGRARKTFADLTPATGARTTRLHRPRPVFAKRLRSVCTSAEALAKAEASPFVSAPADRSQTQSPPCDHDRARRCRVHRIPSQRS